MITGIVNADREATIPLTLAGPLGDQQSIIAVIDTGFDHFLTLSPALINTLRCPFVSLAYVNLADGSLKEIAVYAVLVDWDGQMRSIEVYEIDAAPLVGMRMIYGFELNVQAVDGGPVTLKKMVTEQVS